MWDTGLVDNDVRDLEICANLYKCTMLNWRASIACRPTCNTANGKLVTSSENKLDYAIIELLTSLF